MDIAFCTPVCTIAAIKIPLQSGVVMQERERTTCSMLLTIGELQINSANTCYQLGGNIWLHGGRVLSERPCENLSFSVYPQTKLKEQRNGMASFTSRTLLQNKEHAANLNAHARAYFFLPT